MLHFDAILHNVVKHSVSLVTALHRVTIHFRGAGILLRKTNIQEIDCGGTFWADCFPHNSLLLKSLIFGKYFAGTDSLPQDAKLCWSLASCLSHAGC